MTPTTMTDITPIDLVAERAVVGPAVNAAVQRVLESGRFVLGPEVEALEREFASLCGVSHGVGVASGTDALIVGLHALGIQPGDHVVTTPFTFFASSAAIALVGAKPVLADIDPETALIDVEAVRTAVDNNTTCLLPVHLYGQLADMRGLRELADERGLMILEDGAQAHGSMRDGYACGTLGDAGTFSFYVTKNLGAAGEGGLVVTDRDDVNERLRQLRDHGSPAKYVHALLGTNSRLHAIQAAVLNVKLPYLAAWNARRDELAQRYTTALTGSEGMRPLVKAPDVVHAWHQYAVRIPGEGVRDRVQADLAQRGIFAAVHYPTPVHLQEAAQEWGYGPGDFPHAEALAREVLCLPIHPFLADADVDRVVEGLLESIGRQG